MRKYSNYSYKYKFLAKYVNKGIKNDKKYGDAFMLVWAVLKQQHLF